MVLVDDVVAVDLGVDGRDLLQRRHAGLHENDMEADAHAVALLEAVPMGLPQGHDLGHVHLVEGGEHGGGVLRLAPEAAGDGLAQARHLHLLLARGPVAARRGAATGATAAFTWVATH